MSQPTELPDHPPTPSRNSAPAMALVELLREHSDITAITEAHAQIQFGELRLSVTGLVEGTQVFDVLRQCAERFGGSIRPAHEWESAGVRYRTHQLKTTWRDVPLVISGGVSLVSLVREPLAVSA